MSTSCLTAERVVTLDGTVWTLREIGADHDGRYAPETVAECPRWVLEPGARLMADHGARPEAPQSQVPGLSFRVGVTWGRGVLRVDAIQRQALLEMGKAWNTTAAADDIVESLSRLGDVVASDSLEGEEDEAAEGVAEAAMLQEAEVEITLDEALRLRSELDAVIEKLSRGRKAVGAVRAVERVA